MNSKIKHLPRITVGYLLVTAPVALVTGAEIETGWSVDAKVLEAESSAVINGFTLDGKESGSSLGASYAFNKYFTVQAAYLDLGEHYATDCPPPLVCIVMNEDQVELTGLSVAVLGTWPITDVFEVYGKLGVMGWDANFRQFARDDSANEVVYGAGIGIWFAPNWQFNLQYEKVNDFDLESASLGLTYRF